MIQVELKFKGKLQLVYFLKNMKKEIRNSIFIIFSNEKEIPNFESKL